MTLVCAGLRHYWRAHLALMLAAAVGVAVLTGSLLVGSSVKGSLREHALERLGGVDEALIATDFFRAALAAAVPSSAPVIITSASASHAESGAAAGHIQAFGVDERFWKLMGDADAWRGIGEDDAVINAALARQLQARVGDEILIRAQKPSAVPRETFIGEREETVATIRLTVKKIAGSEGNFSLAPSQADPLNVFVPLTQFSRRLEQPGRANVILTANQNAQANINRAAELDDLGIKVLSKQTRTTPTLAYASVDSAQIFIPKYVTDLTTQTAASINGRSRPTLTYLANAMTLNGRMTPYSTAAALDDLNLGPDEIALNAWTADDLSARIGDNIQMTYFLPTAGQFIETTATLTVARIVQMDSPLVSAGLTPEFPGIANAETIDSWNPPFPMDMKRIRPKDEAYWDKYRAAPKAFVSLATGRRLWANPYGDATSIRVEGVDAPVLQKAMRERLDPARAGLRFEPVRRRAIEASQGASDFGGLFIGFSFFLLISASMLIHALFQLSVQSRAREFGILSATGLPPSLIRNLMLAEGSIVAAAGGALGIVLATGYAALLIHGLRTWWIGAVGAPFLRLHVDSGSLAGGFIGGFVIAMISMLLSVRGVARQSLRGLLAGRSLEEFEPRRHKGTEKKGFRISQCLRVSVVSIVFFVIGIVLAAIAPTRPAESQAGMFFGAGAALLVASLTWCRAMLRKPPRPIGPERLTLARLGFSAARRRPGRSMLVIGLIACATFIIVAVGAQRQTPPASNDKHSGSGGFALIAESSLPMYHALDPQVLGVARAWPMRLETGDDPSCLNLYRSAKPRVAGVAAEFIQRGGFAFSQSLAADEATKNNPWLLLDRPLPDGATPAIGDANTVMWLLHSGLGRDIEVAGHRLRFVALLHGSIFQSELIVSERNFVRMFPRAAGWRLFAIETHGDPRRLAAQLESFYVDFGLDAVATRDRLAALLAVENTYLSIFMALGGLGLLLGTVGMALALLRNLIERRREFALLRAVGFRLSQLVWLTGSENMVLILIGMAIGAGAALVAVWPSSLARSAPVPWLELLFILIAVMIVGAVAVVAGTAAVLRSPAIKVLKED